MKPRMKILTAVAALALFCVGGYASAKGIDRNGRTVVSGAADAYSPGLPTKANANANTSGAVTGIAANACVRISCNQDAAYRVGSATPTAVLADDNELPKGAVEKFCLRSGETAIAFISAAAWTCKVSVTTPPTP